MLLRKGELKRLYAELPTIKCQGRCQGSCGPIEFTDAEWERVCHRLGEEPAHAARSDHGVLLLPPPPDMTCPLLGADGRCTIYAIRPMICRLWGIVDVMPCPWGCKPSPRYLTGREGFVFMIRAEGMTAREAEAYLSYCEERGFLQQAMRLRGLEAPEVRRLPGKREGVRQL